MSLFYFCLDDLSNDGSGVLKKIGEGSVEGENLWDP